jgi:type VI secretion system secreted protein VgrG
MLVFAVGMAGGAPAAFAAQPPVGLGTAQSYAVLAATTVTNTGPSVIAGDIGLSPGTSVTGFPPGVQTTGTMQVTTAAAAKAQADLTTAYNDAAGRTPATTVTSDLGGQTLSAGVYQASSAMSLTGTLTLNGGPADIFIFQAGSTLITASNATVALTGGVSACNVFWQVGSSTTLGTRTTFVGTVMSLASTTLNTGSTVRGRVMARNGAVTLDTNTITVPNCSAVGPTATAKPTPTATPTATVIPSATPTRTATAKPTPKATPTATPTRKPTPTPGDTTPGVPAATATGTTTGTGGGAGTGGTGSGTGTGAGSGSGAGSPVPVGHPDTGEGGAAAVPANRWLLAGGALALIGGAAAAARAARRPDED